MALTNVEAPFEDTEQRQLYKLAAGFGEVSNVAAETLNFLRKFGAFMGPGEREQMRELQERLDRACVSVS